MPLLGCLKFASSACSCLLAAWPIRTPSSGRYVTSSMTTKKFTAPQKGKKCEEEGDKYNGKPTHLFLFIGPRLFNFTIYSHFHSIKIMISLTNFFYSKNFASVKFCKLFQSKRLIYSLLYFRFLFFFCCTTFKMTKVGNCIILMHLIIYIVLVTLSV